MKRQVILVFVILLANTIAGLAQTKKDSLWRVWHDTTKPDTSRLIALQAITWPMLNVNLDSVFILASEQLRFAREKGLKKWIAKAHYNLGVYYYLTSDYANSLEAYEKSLELRKELSDLKGQAAIYGNMGLIYSQQGNSMKDLEYQLKSMEINEKLNDTSGMTSNFNNLAVIYHEQLDSAKALEYYGRSLRMYDAQKNKKEIALVHNNIGSMYLDYLLYEKALNYLYQSLEVRKSLQDRLGMGINYVNIATAYTKMGDYPNAKENALLSIQYFEALRDTPSIAHAYFTLGDIANYEKRYPEAIKWCNQSLEIALKKNKVPIQKVACSCIYRAYKALGNTGKALEYFEQFVALSDSLKQEELKMALNRLELEKELLVDSLSREEDKNDLRMIHAQEIARKNLSTKIILSIGLGVLMMALLFLSRMLFYQRNSEVFKKKTLDLEKQQLVNQISLLKTQVNPHFLFNSLSILSSLVRVNPELSEQFIDQLSRSYRYILEQKDQSLVTLRTELGFIESYAFLLNIRFEHKFKLDIHLDEATLDQYRIAPLTLQLLIENAVKHNRMSLQEPLVVNIKLGEDQELIVSNRLQPRTTPSVSTGVGLENIINRYALLTAKSVRAGAVGQEFVVHIPLLNENE